MNSILFEDEHLLVANKPAGWNTHAPSPFAGEGIYEYLKNREPRWSNLAIIHRLDKETSGVMVFGRTPQANRSLTAQFAQRRVRKKYLLLTDRAVSFQHLTARSQLKRVGEKYRSAPEGERAETVFHRMQNADSSPGAIWIEAEPLTGRTHQIRVHAAENGFPILGDTVYGGTPAERICLHAAELRLVHPATGKPLAFTAPPGFSANTRLAFRDAFIDPTETTAYRLIHGAADDQPGFYVDRLGDYLLAQSENNLSRAQSALLRDLSERFRARGVYHKILRRKIQRASAEEASPQLIMGEAAPGTVLIRENGLQFELRFDEGYSVGLFLDQRENRRRLMVNYVAPEFFLQRHVNSGDNSRQPGSSLHQWEVLNAFAYTCAFSVCAAQAGARVTSLDLSKKYLDWGKQNFQANALDPAIHEFIFGDAFEWLRRLGKKDRRFDLILLDPPTFSRSKEHGIFQAERNYGQLVPAALPLLKSGGILFASTNAATLPPEKFLQQITGTIASAQRKILQQKFIPQPPDFPMNREEPGYLKTVWLRVS